MFLEVIFPKAFNVNYLTTNCIIMNLEANLRLKFKQLSGF